MAAYDKGYRCILITTTFFGKSLLEEDRTNKVNLKPGTDRCSLKSSAQDFTIHLYQLDVRFSPNAGQIELTLCTLGNLTLDTQSSTAI